MTRAPLEQAEDLLPLNLKRIVARDTPIPTIAQRAAEIRATHPTLVRADIGQISGFEPDLEILYGPPTGLERLRSLIAETWNRTMKLGGGRLPGLPEGLRAENVAVCTGAAEALSLLMQCFATHAVVALPRGYWENYVNAVDLAGGRSVFVDYFDDDGNLDPEGLSRRLKEENVAVLLANFPCNPTGAVLSEEETAAVAQVAKDLGIVIVADEVYARLRFDGHPPTSFLAHAPGHAIAIGSASKEYLIPGARVGYMIAANADLTDRLLRRLIRANTACPNVLGQRLLADLLEKDLADLRDGKEAGLLGRLRDELGLRRDALVEVLERHGMPPVGRPGHRPEGTIFLMAALPDWWNGDDEEFCAQALEAACVSAVPGSAFGLDSSIRLSFGGMSVDQVRQLDENLAAFKASAS